MIIKTKLPAKRRREAADFRGGFTLIEILIAIAIFAVVVTTIFSSFRAVLSRNEAIRHGDNTYEMARSCMNRILMDLTSLYIERPPLYQKPDFNAPPDPYRFVAEQIFTGARNFTRLRFSSAAHLPMGGQTGRGLAEIVYYVPRQSYSETPPVLRRADRSYPYDLDPEFSEREHDPVLCEDVAEFELTFYDEEGNAHEEWNSESDRYRYATPRMVAVKLKIAPAGAQSHDFFSRITLPVYRDKIE
jgi:general secretion pathway protein J